MQALDVARAVFDAIWFLVALGLGIWIGRACERETTLDAIDIIERMHDDRF